jgi:hypothetical protein
MLVDASGREVRMDVVFLLLIAALGAVTVGLVYALERLRGKP